MKVQYALKESGPVVSLKPSAKMRGADKPVQADWSAAQSAIVAFYKDKSDAVKAKAGDVIRRVERKIASAAAKPKASATQSPKSESEAESDAPARRSILPGAGRREDVKTPEAKPEKD